MMLPESISQSPDFFFRQVGHAAYHVTLRATCTDEPVVYFVCVWIHLAQDMVVLYKEESVFIFIHLHTVASVSTKFMVENLARG
jgi:hypothetical protein